MFLTIVPKYMPNRLECEESIVVYSDFQCPLSFCLSLTFCSLYPLHLCRGVYSFRLSICPYMCSFVQSFVCLYFRPIRGITSKFYMQATRVEYISTNHSSESIHIWTIGTLEGRLSFHDSSPQGPCPGVGLEVKL